MNENLLIWFSDVHEVSNDFEAGILGKTTPSEGAAFGAYLTSLNCAGCIDTGDEKDHYGSGTGDEQDNYVTNVLNTMPWLPLNAGFNATAPTLPGNHDEILDYPDGTMPTATDFSLFDARFWGPPYHWTADWNLPQVRFIAIHTYVHHSADGFAGFFHCDQSEVDWLQAELDALPAYWSAIVCAHAPAHVSFGNQVHDNFGGLALRACLAANNDVIVAYFNGHRHQTLGTASLNSIPHFNGASTAYTLGNSNGGYMPITYDENARTLTLDCLYFRGASKNTRLAGFTPLVINLPPLAANVPPVAAFTSGLNTGIPTDFDATGSSDPDFGGIETWEWDFGDGETGEGETLTHIYAVDGTYTVELTVTDNRGGSDTFSDDVVVLPLQSVEGGGSMSVVVSLEDYRPSPRYDGEPWTDARIYEGTASDGAFTLLETIPLSPVDSDPENPAYRNFTTDLGTADELWYKIIFVDADLSTGQPTVPIQNVADDRPVYASVSELAQLLRVNASQRHNSLMRVLKTAADEIDHEIGTADVNGVAPPYSNPPAVAREVNLERAVEHWKQEQSPFGIIGLGDDQSVYTARDSWDRHAHKLAILKGSWGIA